MDGWQAECVRSELDHTGPVSPSLARRLACDAHHVIHWADGGETKLANLVLLCRRHHRLIHKGGFEAEIRDGRPVFRRPDRTLLEDRAPP